MTKIQKLEKKIKCLEKEIAELKAIPKEIHNHYHYIYPWYQLPVYPPQYDGPYWVTGDTVTTDTVTITDDVQWSYTNTTIVTDDNGYVTTISS